MKNFFEHAISQVVEYVEKEWSGSGLASPHLILIGMFQYMEQLEMDHLNYMQYHGVQNIGLVFPHMW